MSKFLTGGGTPGFPTGVENMGVGMLCPTRGGSSQYMGEAWGLKMLLKNTCEGVPLLVKLWAISCFSEGGGHGGIGFGRGFQKKLKDRGGAPHAHPPWLVFPYSPPHYRKPWTPFPSPQSEYNLEFQGSIRSFQKRALLWSFTQKCLEITKKCVKITLLLAKRALFVKYYKLQHPSTEHWFFLDYSLVGKTMIYAMITIKWVSLCFVSSLK